MRCHGNGNRLAHTVWLALQPDCIRGDACRQSAEVATRSGRREEKICVQVAGGIGDRP